MLANRCLDFKRGNKDEKSIEQLKEQGLRQNEEKMTSFGEQEEKKLAN